MASFSWRHAIRVNISILKFMGLWPKGNEGYECNTYAIFAAAVLLLIHSHIIFQTVNVYFVSDLKELSAIIFILFTEWLVSLKMFYFIRNMKMVKKLMLDVESDDFHPSNNGQISTVQVTVAMWQTIYFVYAVPAVITLILWTVFPLVDGTFREYRLPYSVWYPYDIKKSPTYEITYFYQTMSFWAIAIAGFNMDTMIAALMMLSEAQCEILCENLRNLPSSSYKEKLKLCIDHHKNILRYLHMSWCHNL